MSVAYVDLLDEVIDDIAADDAVSAFVITAEGTTNFSVGMNLEELGGAKKISGPDALAIGLANEVWPLAELEDRAIALAVELAAQPRHEGHARRRRRHPGVPREAATGVQPDLSAAEPAGSTRHTSPSDLT